MMYDGLYCSFDQCAMGEGTERYSHVHGMEREHMDAMAAESHRRADAAQQAGRFDPRDGPGHGAPAKR
jgi:acetyl-CoA C-acetyltransferase